MKRDKPTDFYDEHHLRYCDESFIEKRFLPYDSSFNMRDIGGYTNKEGKRIKWNKIYRGEELRYLSHKDYKEFCKLGIQHVFDFRDEWAPVYRSDKLPVGADYENIPVLKNLKFMDLAYDEVNSESVNEFMKSMYLAQAKERASEFARVLKKLRDEPDTVIYYHCTNGKDRTGFMTALIMLVAGISEEKIISEYSLTNHNFDQAYETLAPALNQGGSVGYDDPEREFYGVNPDWLQVQLDYIKNNYGNVDNYLISNTDLTKEDLQIIRENILEST